jgi:hypothetical protein
MPRPEPSSAPPHTLSAMLKLDDGAKSVLERERVTVAERVSALRRQADSLHVLVADVDRELGAAERLLRQIDEILGLAPQLPIEASHEELRGQRLREVAIAVLEERRGAGVVIHYTEWLELLAEAGVRVGGKNPSATLLTQLAKADRVESVKARSGLYRLRAA